MQKWSRRGVFGLAAAAGASLAVPATARPANAVPSLDALARTKGMRFGSALSTHELSDPRMRTLMREQCGVMVTGNAFKWPQTQSGPDSFTFGRADALAAFAKQNGLLLRGHNLLWQRMQFIPDWVKAYDFGKNPRATAERLLHKHITTEMRRYPQVISWDVVNETIDADTGKLRNTIFTKTMGPEVIDFVYHTAREAAPHAQLVYNDYMCWETFSAKHRAGVLRFLERLKKRNVPVDALGVQSHIGANNNIPATEFGVPQETEWRKFLDEVTAMGYGLLVTEFDVNGAGLPTVPVLRERMIADYARAYLDIVLSYKQVSQVLTWGLVDKYSWLQPRFPRRDGTPKRPLPFEADYTPAPLYYAMANAFRSAPKR